MHRVCISKFLTHTRLTYPTCRCSQRNIPRGSCYLWIASERPRSHPAEGLRAAVGTTAGAAGSGAAAACAFWAALRNGRGGCRWTTPTRSDCFHTWSCSESARGSLLRDHRKGPREDQIPSDPCNMTGSTYSENNFTSHNAQFAFLWHKWMFWLGGDDHLLLGEKFLGC